MFQQSTFRRPKELSKPGMLIIVSLGLLAFLFIADLLIEQRPFAPRTFWALFDGLVHGIVALIVTLPLFRTCTNAKQTTILYLVIFFTATLIDLDHFVAASELDIYSAISLDIRPQTHSLTFAVAVGVVVLLAFRNPIVAWGMFAALSSHFLRDASGGLTPILWPIPIYAISGWIYYTSEIGLLILSYLLVRVPFL